LPGQQLVVIKKTGSYGHALLEK